VLVRVPALTSVHLQLGALYERKPDNERALAAYRQLLALEPGNARALAAIERLSKQF
jgi:Flp pilus assembly protein TadD